MTRSGTLSQLRPLVRRTGGTASGSSAFALGMVVKPSHSVPTPTSSDHIERKCTSSEALNYETNKSVTLDRFVQQFPTPTADKCVASTPTREMAKRFRSKGRSGSFVEAVAATMWPTPDASMGTMGRVSKEPPVGKRKSGAKKSITLNDAVKWEMFRTPTAHDWKNCAAATQVYLSDQVEQASPSTNGGQLNPT
jgi:hypothetical protein